MNWTDDTTIPDAEYGYCPQCLDVELQFDYGWESDEGIHYMLKCPACGANVQWDDLDIPLSVIIPPYED